MATSPVLHTTEHHPTDDDGSGVLVVLVHGSLDRSASFARVTRRLHDLHWVTYDRRGFEHSRAAGPARPTLDGQVDDLLEVIAERPAVVVGHSMGGTVALAAALRRGGPWPVVAVGAWEPPLPWLDSARRPGRTATPEQSQSSSAGVDTPEAAAEAFFRRMVGDDAWERLPALTRQARQADGPALLADGDALNVDRPPFDADQLIVPAVFGWGSTSQARHRHGVDWLVTHCQDSVPFEIAGAGHGAHLTHPGAFARFVRATVARAGTGSATVTAD